MFYRNFHGCLQVFTSHSWYPKSNFKLKRVTSLERPVIARTVEAAELYSYYHGMRIEFNGCGESVGRPGRKKCQHECI